MTERPEKRRSNTWIIVVAIIAILLAACSCAAVAGAILFARARPSPGGRVLKGIELPEFGFQTEAIREMGDTFEVDIPVLVEVSNDVGTVEILGTDQDQVRVEALTRGYGPSREEADRAAEEVEITIEQRGDDHVYIAARQPSGIRRKAPTTSLVIHVPHESSLKVTSKVGNVKVAEIEGSLNIEVNVGTIDVRGWDLTEDSFLTTDVGKIQVRLGPESSFYLDAAANVGDIDTDYDIEDPRERRPGPGDRLLGAVGEDPEVELRIRTNTGAIKVLRER